LRITKWLVPVAAAIGIIASAGAASASTAGLQMGDAHSVTHVSADPDSGGNGNWAMDNFWRSASLSVPQTAPLTDCAPLSTACYAYTASLSDSGSFTTIPGAFTPDQGGADAGKVISGTHTGSMHGYGDFSTFYANSLPSHAPNAGVPYSITGSPDSSQFPARMFPAGTTVTGLNEATWSYSYELAIRTLVPVHYWTWVKVHHHWIRVLRVRWEIRYSVQHWTDAYDNGGGQSAGAGNITG
jgi:hypothetical protein